MTHHKLIQKFKLFIVHLFKGSSYTRVQLNDWLKSISISSKRVLEVGASLNPVIKKVNKWDVKEYKTLDNNIEVDCKPDFFVDLNLLHFSDKNGWGRSVQKVLQYKPNVLFCLEVMEYIYKPETVLKFFYEVLAPKGTLYISFHSIYPIHQPYKFDSLRYTKWGIVHLLEEVGFTKWEITPRIATKGRDALNAFYKAEKMHGLRNSNEQFNIGYFIKAIK